MKTLNEVYSSLATRRRYEVWFLRFALTSGEGAWWLRYLLMNPGCSGCAEDERSKPVQVWATWFPRDGVPQTFIEGFPVQELDLSARRKAPFQLRIGDNAIDENSCRGALQVEDHSVSWDLCYRSDFRVVLSDKGWIGFSRTPHSDARFSGWISLDGRKFAGEPIGFGLQGHNCGYRHRTFWRWCHACFPRADGRLDTFEALVYDMPLGLVFRKAVLWHEGRVHLFRRIEERKQDAETLRWEFVCVGNRGMRIDVALDGSGRSLHRLPYLKTDCTGSFGVANNSFARAVIQIRQPNGRSAEPLETVTGAVVEMTGNPACPPHV